MNRQIVCSLLLLTACQEVQQRQKHPDYEMPPGEQPTRTIVTLKPDGPPTVKVEVISEETLRADFETRERLKNGIGVAHQGISVDSPCPGGDSLWLFDNTGNVPGSFPLNHEICFLRNGVSGCVDLKQYNRYCTVFGDRLQCQHWAWSGGNAVGSFWSGSDSGHFAGAVTSCNLEDHDLPPHPIVFFEDWEQRNNAQQLLDFPSVETLCMCGG